MKVLITGATGLLGSYIVDACVERGDSIRVIVRKTSDLSYLKKFRDIEYVYGDLSDPDSLDIGTKGIDVVYHSAARVSDWGSRKQFIEANYTGTQNTGEACRKNSVKKLIYISSPSVVFDYTDEIMIDESYPYPEKFANYYSEAKALSEKYIRSIHDPKGLETVILRPHAMWGPRDKTGFLPRVIAKIKTGKLKNLSGGKRVIVDMCYVQNAADSCINAAISPSSGGKTYFISNDEPVDAWKFFDNVCETLGIPKIEESINPQRIMPIISLIELIWKIPFLAKNYPPPLTRYAVGVLTNSTTYNLNAAKLDLSYKPKINNVEGLRKLKDWIEEIGGIDEYIRHS